MYLLIPEYLPVYCCNQGRSFVQIHTTTDVVYEHINEDIPYFKKITITFLVISRSAIEVGTIAMKFARRNCRRYIDTSAYRGNLE